MLPMGGKPKSRRLSCGRADSIQTGGGLVARSLKHAQAMRQRKMGLMALLGVHPGKTHTRFWCACWSAGLDRLQPWPQRWGKRPLTLVLTVPAMLVMLAPSALRLSIGQYHAEHRIGRHAPLLPVARI